MGLRRDGMCMTVASKITAMAEAAGLSLEPTACSPNGAMLPGQGRSSSEEHFSASGAVAATGKVTQLPTK